MKRFGGYSSAMIHQSHPTQNFRDNKNRAIIAFDRRRVHRQRVLKDARIILNNGRSTMSCTIRDLSALGARLQASPTPDLPENFMLIITSDGTMVPARRIWWLGNQMGIKFTGKFEPVPRK
jgi:hypothetical protein